MLAAIAVCGLLGVLRAAHAASRVSGAMTQGAYVWQRTWDTPTTTAVETRAHDLAELVVLAAEVSSLSGRAAIARIHPDFAALKRTDRPVGLALRIGPYRGPFSDSDAVAQMLATLARELVDEAAAAGCTPADRQIDFDCASSGLDGYLRWVKAIKAALPGTPLAVTALPAWLNSRGFDALVREAGAFVLQVHSLEPPDSPASATPLCDPAAARRWVNRAARAGVPFRVALPTYGDLLVFNDKDRFIGVTAEADGPTLAPGYTLRELSADPAALAALVQSWTAERPACMTGLLWYRLPVESDRLNWSWPTLASVMQGVAPVPNVAVRAGAPSSGLVEVLAVNDGAADAPLPARTLVTWAGAELIASDALADMDLTQLDARSILLTPSRSPGSLLAPRLRAGETRQLGWVRLDRPAEVTIRAPSSIE